VHHIGPFLEHLLIVHALYGERSTRVSSLARIVLVIAAMAVALSLGNPRASAKPSARNLVPPGWPQSLTIPKIGTSAPIESLSLTSGDSLHAPFRWMDAGWYSRGPRPGEPGNAVMFGHLDSYTGPAVFWSLNTLQPGDSISIAYRDGRRLTFRVMWQHVYPTTQMPQSWMFGANRQRGVIIFTCAGIFHSGGTGYDHKLVIFARLILPNGRLG
jgi:Sortase domain